MADPICRWRNPSVKQVVEFNGLFPLFAMKRELARSFIEKRWNIIGCSSFFTTSYQLAAEMGMYYEDDVNLYPRFNSLISYEEALEYILAWGKKYYAPNPYTKSMSYEQKPVIINNFLVNWVFEHKVALWSEALKAMFKDDIGNTDILVNMINNFTEVSIKDDIISLKPDAPSVPYDFVHLDVDAKDKRVFFEFFGKLKDNTFLTSKEKFPLQQIFYGAPGTGKSHKINEQTKGESVIRTTFHPDSDYSTFVGAYKPTTKSVELRDVSGHKIIEEGKEVKEDRIVYEFVAQAFLQAYILAWKSYSQPTDEGVIKPQYLVIEEINRGNCAQIFGDIFQLLDRDDNGFSKYEITSDADLQKYIAEQNLAVSGVCDSHGKDISDKINSGELLKLPNNFYIWATMNTSDQSLFPIDSAFKRRWDWKYIPIDTNKENWTIKTAKKEYSWSSFLQKINDEIDDTTHSEDKMLGFYFCKADDNVVDADKFVNKVLFYIYNDVFKDYGFDRDMFKGEDGKPMSFHSYYNLDGSINENLVEKFLDNLIKEENSTIPSEENVEQ